MLLRVRRDGWCIPDDATEGLWEYWQIAPTAHPDWELPPPLLLSGKWLLVRRGLCVPVELDPADRVLHIGDEVRAVRQLPDGVWRLRRPVSPDDPTLD